MARQHIQRLPDGSWEHLPTDQILDKCKMFPINHYIKVRRKTLYKHYASEHSALYRNCLNLATGGGDHNVAFWWHLENS